MTPSFPVSAPQKRTQNHPSQIGVLINKHVDFETKKKQGNSLFILYTIVCSKIVQFVVKLSFWDKTYGKLLWQQRALKWCTTKPSLLWEITMAYSRLKREIKDYWPTPRWDVNRALKIRDSSNNYLSVTLTKNLVQSSAFPSIMV